MNIFLLSALLSLLPFMELRLSIPLAIAQNANPIAVFIVCTAANAAIILPIFLFLDCVHRKMLKIKPYSKASELVFKRIRPKSIKVRGKMAIYGFPALALFVSIPIPVSGAYTGTLIAWLLNLERKKSFIAIAAGVIIAGILVTLIASGVLAILS